MVSVEHQRAFLRLFCALAVAGLKVAIEPTDSRPDRSGRMPDMRPRNKQIDRRRN
jgi:hypothetical protein